MRKARILELAEEASDCIAVNDLSGTDLVAYLNGFLGDVLKEAKKEGVKRGRRR